MQNTFENGSTEMSFPKMTLAAAGYNLIKGNPCSVAVNTGVDPGFMAPVFNMQFSPNLSPTGYY